ncbi:MAG: hypothetical protein GXP24_12060 [Planctomycetes bacterium]|nr:hypothetical protein [Planctomycetota bacterium]
MIDDSVLRAARSTKILVSALCCRTVGCFRLRFLPRLLKGTAIPIISCCLAICFLPSFSAAVTPESPEVRLLIERGLQSLEGHAEQRLGGVCLVALAFVKDGASPDNPHVQAAVAACQSTDAQQARATDVYSNGLAIIFLSELNPGKYRDLIARFAGAMANRQKAHGGWGYDALQTGDTSQTQYAALSYWELLQIGMAPPVEKVEACANWLLRTQDPTGAWGYQGKDPENFERVEQREVTASMLAAGLGSTMIFGNVLGLTQPGGGGGSRVADLVSEAPSALKRADLKIKKQMRTLSGNGVQRERLLSAISRGQAWYDKNFDEKTILRAHYPCYMLYSLERYKSFEELLTGNTVEEPDWYQMGYKYLQAKQLPEGGWRSRSGKPCATSFAILFLLRSTQKSIKANLGEGTLIGGRGLSANLARMKMRRGRLVTEEQPTEIDKFLGMLDEDASAGLEALVNDPTALQVHNVGPEQARRLQQLVKSGAPAGRILAVRALSKMRSLNYAPTLIFALTDPDKRVVREARDGLRFVSRRFQGFGLPDNFSDSQRYNAIDQWKTWYRRVRPDAPPLP